MFCQSVLYFTEVSLNRNFQNIISADISDFIIIKCLGDQSMITLHIKSFLILILKIGKSIIECLLTPLFPEYLRTNLSHIRLGNSAL